MNVITLSREHYSGGGEIAEKLGQALGWQVLDRDLVHQAAAIEHVPDAEFDKLDDQAFSLAERLIFDPPYERYLHGLREVARRTTAAGNVILVGRGMRHLLGYSDNYLHVRLVAPIDWRAGRAAPRNGMSRAEAHAHCAALDRQRDRFLRYYFGRDANQPSQFDVVFNTARVPIDDIVAAVVSLVRRDWPTPGPTPGRRLLTVTNALGAGAHDWNATLAERLGLRLVDRSVLDHLAGQLDMTVSQVEQIDEQPGWVFQRMFASNIHNRYFKALKQRIVDEATQGDALIVNRGAPFLLRDRADACHVCLMAAADQRLLRVMQERWLSEDAARSLIADNDAQRRRFYEVYFNVDWTNPLEYHLAINAGRLGAATLELIGRVASSQ